ncbi:MAG: V-type ATP synthase subunit I [Clostridiales bacterium]|nr:V-type ATP synthase subunit I [Clostridiales bacterium]
MSIVKMQKVSVIGLDKIKGRLIARMMDLEAVELTDQTEKLSEEFWADNTVQDGAQDQVTYFEGKIGRAAQALDIIDQYGELKKPLFKTRRIVSTEEAASIPSQEIETEDLIARLIHLNEELRNKRDEINRLDTDNIMFEPWQAYDVPLDQSQTETITTIMGVLPAAYDKDRLEEVVRAITERYVMKQVNEDKAMKYLAFLVPKEMEDEILQALKDEGFQALEMRSYKGTVTENILKNSQKKLVLQEDVDKILQEIRELAQNKEHIEDYQDILTVELDKKKTRSKLLKTKKTFYMEGWVPEGKVEQVKQLLDDNECYYEFRDPEEGETVPVLLKNSKFATPIEAVTEMYSLPAYGTIDPTAIYSIWYIIFFGLMFSDAGYGLLMIIACGVALKKYNFEGTMYKFVKGFLYCGISTFFWGAMFGSWFGDLISVVSSTFFGKEIAIKPILFDPLSNPMPLLVASIVLGVAHLFLALGIEGYKLLKQGKLVDFICNIILWYATIIGLILWLAGSSIGPAATTVGKYMSIIAIVGLALTGGRDRKGFGKIMGGFSNVYDITSWLSDIMSYARIMALGLATGAIAQVVNTIGTLAGGGVKGAILFIIVFLLGHTLNFGINVIGAFIHSARLQFVEFFGKFYEDGGDAFAPLKKNTKYIKIENK